MRYKYCLLPIFMLVLSLFSCQRQESELFQEQQTHFLITANTSNGVTYDDMFLERGCSGFNLNLHWASFLTVRILYDDEVDVYRSDFLALLNSNENNLISLDVLLGEAALLPNFRAVFINLYKEFRNNSLPIDCGRPEGSEDYPRDDCSMAPIEDYLKYMLEDNCVELYFPRGLSFDFLDFSMTSLAHPLVTVDAALGLKRFRSENCIFTEELTVDVQYLVDNPNIILARPYRILGLGGCPYDEYNFDFTEFLREE